MMNVLPAYKAARHPVVWLLLALSATLIFLAGARTQ